MVACFVVCHLAACAGNLRARHRPLVQFVPTNQLTAGQPFRVRMRVTEGRQACWSLGSYLVNIRGHPYRRQMWPAMGESRGWRPNGHGRQATAVMMLDGFDARRELDYIHEDVYVGGH